MSTRPSLRVHLYTASLDDVDDDYALVGSERLLAREELQSRDRLVFEADRREYLYSHALLRIALSRHSPEVAPAAWQFDRGEHGRPRLAGASASTGLHFNLSHSSRMVACVIARTPLLGVDVEAQERGRSAIDIAQSFFAPAEVRTLGLLNEPARSDLFLRYWTLKESYLKARGIGLALPLDRFWFVLTPGGDLTVEFGTEMQDLASWTFLERQPTLRHRLAVAVGIEPPPAEQVELIETTMDEPGFFYRSAQTGLP